MAAAAAQPVPSLTMEEYLQTTYHPDYDFVDGHLEERNMGGTKHGLLQSLFCIWFGNHPDWNLVTINDQRIQVAPNRVRLPDVAVVFDDEAVLEDPRRTPPYIAIEVLSPDDRIPRVIPRLRDFIDMGAAHVWLIDPLQKIGYTFTTEAGLVPAADNQLRIPNSPVYVDLASFFTWIDTRATRKQ